MQDAARWKEAAARAAVELVEDGMVLGLGTGSTATFALTALAERMREGLRVTGIPTSEATAAEARRLGLPLAGFAEHGVIDLTIDGADEVRLGSLDLIKGGGGALLREKIVAAASRRLVIVADESKLVSRLGEGFRLPVELVPFGWEVAARRLESLGAAVTLRTRPDGAPFVTDGGHHIVDCAFPGIDDPGALEQEIKALVGVVESGLFVGMANTVAVGGPDGVRWLAHG